MMDHLKAANNKWPRIQDVKRCSNTLPIWGNDKSMNLNHLILANIQGSSYFKGNLSELKTFFEVVDEIYYHVAHLEPWEKGSRKTAGQTGMCGGVRGVGAGGVVSSCFCILFKLFTLKITRRQLCMLINHRDSPYIRGIGFMFIRYCQPPSDLWDWYEPYLNDPEEIDVKAGGGCTMTIGEVVQSFLTKLEWFSTLFPRIPVPVQSVILDCLDSYKSGNSNVNKQTQQSSDYGGANQFNNNYNYQDNSTYSSQMSQSNTNVGANTTNNTNNDASVQQVDTYREKDSRDHNLERASKGGDRERDKGSPGRDRQRNNDNKRSSRSRDRSTRRRSRQRHSSRSRSPVSRHHRSKDSPNDRRGEKTSKNLSSKSSKDVSYEHLSSTLKGSNNEDSKRKDRDLGGEKGASTDRNERELSPLSALKDLLAHKEAQRVKSNVIIYDDNRAVTTGNILKNKYLIPSTGPSPNAPSQVTLIRPVALKVANPKINDVIKGSKTETKEITTKEHRHKKAKKEKRVKKSKENHHIEEDINNKDMKKEKKHKKHKHKHRDIEQAMNGNDIGSNKNNKEPFSKTDTEILIPQNFVSNNQILLSHSETIINKDGQTFKLDNTKENPDIDDILPQYENNKLDNNQSASSLQLVSETTSISRISIDDKKQTFEDLTSLDETKISETLNSQSENLDSDKRTESEQ